MELEDSEPHQDNVLNVQSNAETVSVLLNAQLVPQDMSSTETTVLSESPISEKLL